ncbi:MAG: efflux RND transporter periplasmic adaptor subunit [Cyanobacteriota bacterium]
MTFLLRRRNLGLLLGGVIAIALFRGCWSTGDEKRARPPVAVAVSDARLGDLPVTYPVTGEVTALASAAIQPQVGGVLQQVHFREGQEVQAGAPLLSLDPAPFLAALGQARAATEKTRARLLEAQAQALRSQTEARAAAVRADRYARLRNLGAVSQDQADQYRSEAESLAAGASSSRSAVVSAKADLAASMAAEAVARLNLSRTTIRSPIQGRTGQLKVTIGNVLREGQGQTLLLVNQFEPIEVRFSVPQDHLARIRPGQVLTLSDGQIGAVRTIDNAIDPSTGTTTIKASFRNQDQRLVPGQFVKGDLKINTLHQVVLVPETSVQRGQKGSFVWIAVGNRAQARSVQTGPSGRGQVAILQGLNAVDRVITQGQFALSPGAAINSGSDRGGAIEGRRSAR